MRTYHVIEGWALDQYLQLEQDLLQEVEEPTFFTWVVGPTVIYGRHQVASQEMDINYCQEHGIAMIQRKSGGGCVYADRGNLMLSYISPSAHSEQVFECFLQSVAQALRQMGYNAVTTEHNDILVDGYKVAGFACYTSPKGTIVHACMLYDVDLDALERAITPSEVKLRKHAVESVRQRVHNLREWHDWGEISCFRQEISTLLAKNLQE